MTKNTSITTIVAVGLIVAISCKKENTAIVLPQSKEQPKVTTIAASAPYDYSKPVEEILSDARIEGPIADPYLVLVRSGTYLFEYQGRVICNPRGPVCEILVIEWKKNQVYTAGNSTIIDGSAEHPIKVVQALPQWPLYRQASEVSYTETDEEIEINHSYLP